MPIWNIELDNGDIMEVEADTKPSKEEVMQYIQNEPYKEEKEAFAAEDIYPEYNDFGQEILKKGAGLGKFKDVDELTGWSGDATALYSSVLHGGTFGLGDVGASILAPEELKTWELARKANPIYAGIGELTGLTAANIATKGLGTAALAGGVGGVAQGLAAKLGLKGSGQWAASKIGQGAVEGLGFLAEANAIKTIDAMAGTRDWNEAKQGWLDFGKDSPAAMGLGVVQHMILTPLLKYAFSPTYRALRIIGNDALLAGAYEREIAEASGIPAGKALMMGRERAMRDLSPTALKRIQSIEAANPDFAEALNQQLLNPSNGLFINSMRALTGAQTAEYSKIFNEKLYGPGYKNQLGTTDPDFSVGGVLNSMGINKDPANPVKFLFTEKAALARSYALAAAQEHVSKEIHEKGFWAGRQKMAELGTDVLSKMNKETRNSFIEKLAMASEDELTKRTTPEATKQAMNAYKSKLNDILQEVIEKNPNLPQKDAIFEARKIYVENLLETGSDDIFEIDALRGALRTIFDKEIKEGIGVISNLESGIINDVLDNPAFVGKGAPGLFLTNQSLRWGDKVLQTFDVANDFVKKMVADKVGNVSAEKASKVARESLEGVITYLNQGFDAENTIIRKALFKGAIANRFQTAIKNGNTTEANLIHEWTKKNGILVKNNIFRPGEFDEYYKKMMPNIRAFKNIKAIIKASNPEQYAAAPEIGETMANAAAAAATTGMSANSFRYGISNIWKYTKFGGPKTAQCVIEYLNNPSWENLNTMFREIKDTNVRNFFQKMIMEGVKYATSTEEAIANSPWESIETMLWK